MLLRFGVAQELVNWPIAGVYAFGAVVGTSTATTTSHSTRFSALFASLAIEKCGRKTLLLLAISFALFSQLMLALADILSPSNASRCVHLAIVMT